MANTRKFECVLCKQEFSINFTAIRLVVKCPKCKIELLVDVWGAIRLAQKGEEKQVEKDFPVIFKPKTLDFPQ